MKRSSGVRARAVATMSSAKSARPMAESSFHHLPTKASPPVVLAADELEPVRRARPRARAGSAGRAAGALDEGTDLAVLLVALALPAAVEAERDARRRHPEPEARGAGTSDEDPRGIQVGAVGAVLPRVLLERKRRRLEVEAGLGRQPLDEAVADVVGLTAQLAGEVGRPLLVLGLA